MKRILRYFYYLLLGIRLLPCGLLVLLSKNKKVILADLSRWIEIRLNKKNPSLIRKIFCFVYLMSCHQELRSLVYYRLGYVSSFIRFIYPPMPTLYIFTKNIGEGFFIQHGFATAIGARSIGKNCSVNQQVSIGYTNNYTDNDNCPVIGDNVAICAGAIVIGNVSIGDNSIVGAHAVVVKNVPPNCTVVGVPAYIVKRDGRKVHEDL